MKNMKMLLCNATFLFTGVIFLQSCNEHIANASKTPVDYVNPYMGNISHILVPTYPTVQLPNSLLRISPERREYTADQVAGLPVVVPRHRGSSAFSISPVNNISEKVNPVVMYSYDNERITPYRYQVYLDDEQVEVDFAPSHQAAVYTLGFAQEGGHIIINTRNGRLDYNGSGVSGHQLIDASHTRVYVYLETKQTPEQVGVIKEDKTVDFSEQFVEGRNRSIVLSFKEKQINLRYGISYISTEQAKKNLEREITTYDVQTIAEAGRKCWNEALGKIEVQGDDENDKTTFYTSLYRTYERMINLSEDGRYYSGIDNCVHDDEGVPFYIDDWIWDTYRAVHPLRILIEEDMERNIIASYIRMARQSSEGWMPTFPEVTGDSHCMNGNHVVSVIWDAYSKGVRGFDLQAAYAACRSAVMDKSLLPWTRTPKTELDAFYKEKGYFPALKPNETEYVDAVNAFEGRQSVAVTLAACYDDWCLSQIANELKLEDDRNYFYQRSYNYRNLYNEQTAFFHPKDKDGQFIEPFDYRFSGGMGVRQYYDENNGWVYRWDVPHNPADLIALMGSTEHFIQNLNRTFREPLGKSKFEFYAQLPDHTGNVGQFSMANEPSLHVPYLYNYAGQPWMTQKRIRMLLKQWFRNDLMGVPGDEDGGGMSAFVVFSSMGFYPVTPGIPAYNIGSPLFGNVKIKLSNGKTFEIEAQNCSSENKYIQSATLNGEAWNRTWFSHQDIANGGRLVLKMGAKPNYKWGSAPDSAPPSAVTIK